MKTATISLTRKFGDVVIFYLLKICHKNLALFHYVSETVDGRRDAATGRVRSRETGQPHKRRGYRVWRVGAEKHCRKSRLGYWASPTVRRGEGGGDCAPTYPTEGAVATELSMLIVSIADGDIWKKKKMYFFIITLWYSLKYLYYMNYTVYYQHCPICNGK